MRLIPGQVADLASISGKCILDKTLPQHFVPNLNKSTQASTAYRPPILREKSQQDPYVLRRLKIENLRIGVALVMKNICLVTIVKLKFIDQKSLKSRRMIMVSMVRITMRTH